MPVYYGRSAPMTVEQCKTVTGIFIILSVVFLILNTVQYFKYLKKKRTDRWYTFSFWSYLWVYCAMGVEVFNILMLGSYGFMLLVFLGEIVANFL